MGALVSRALRPVRSFNIENRAHRVISKEKPTPAPMYPQAVEDLKRATEAEPDLDEKLSKKDDSLDMRLRDVYVTSTGPSESDIDRESRKNPDRPLPENRKQVEEFELGFNEPARVTYGRTTLRHVITFLTAHQMDPKEVTADKIAEEYKMGKEDVESVLKYFKTFEVYLPETKHTPATFAGPSTMRRKLEESNAFNIIDETGNKKDKNPLEIGLDNEKIKN